MSRPSALVLAAVLLATPCAFARGVEDRAASLPRWAWPTTPEHLEIGRALRASRQAGGAQVRELVDRIVAAGPGAPAAEVDILARGRVPEAGPDDRPQILSEPQRELVLAALTRTPAAAVRDAMRARLDAAPDDTGARLMAIHVLGAIGSARDLARVVDLAPREPRGGEGLLPDAQGAVRSAVAKILGRDAGSRSALADLFRRTDARAGKSLLEALSSSRNPRTLEVLYAAARAHRELRPQAVGLVVASGRSSDADLNAEVADWMMSELSAAHPEYARALARAVGVLDDGRCVPGLIARLEDDSPIVRDAALWALQRISGLGFPAGSEVWLAWHREEEAWHATAVPALRLDLASGNARSIVAALRAYSEHRTRPAALAADVVKLLADPRPELRRLACEVLQRLGDSSACGALVQTLQDTDAGVAEAAWQALKAITGLELPRDPKGARAMLQS